MTLDKKHVSITEFLGSWVYADWLDKLTKQHLISEQEKKKLESLIIKMFEHLKGSGSYMCNEYVLFINLIYKIYKDDNSRENK